MSSINPNNINGQYPIAGQDNDSQGFRDNFTNIKNNFTFSKTEIEDLQNKVLLRSALAGTTLNNELNNNQLKGVQALRFTETVNDLGTIADSSLTVNWVNGHFQYFNLNTDTTLTLVGWPTSGFYTKFRLQVKAVGDDRELTLSSAGVTYNYSTGLVEIQGTTGNTILLEQDRTYLFEFSTYNNGVDVIVQDLLRNYDTISSTTTFDEIEVTGTDASTSTTTGAAVIAGGLGVAGNIYAGAFYGDLYGNLAGDLTGNVTGNVTGVASSATTATSATTAGTVTTAAQPNITSTGTLTSITSSGTILSSGGGIGYTTGAGGTVNQGSGSGKNTAVTLNALTGTITLSSGLCVANAATANTFTMTNSTVAATDLVVIQHQSGGSLGAYNFAATSGSGSVQISVRNLTQADLSESIVLRYAVIKSVNS